MMDTCCRRRSFVLFVLLFVLSIGASAIGQEILPDLSITGLTFTPASPIMKGDLVAVRAVVSASGTVLGDSASVEVSWRRLDKQDLCGATGGIVLLEEKPVFETTIDTSMLTAGTYEVIVQVDPKDRIAETDETNNRMVEELVIQSPQPEVHPVSLTLTPSSPLLWGETATVESVVENTGRLAAGSFHVRFSVLPVYVYDPSTEEAWSISIGPSEGGDGSVLAWSLRSDAERDLGTDALSLAERVESLPDEAWLTFASVRVSGLARDEWLQVSDAFWTGDPLRELLETARTGLIPFTSAQVDLLERGVTTYAIRVSVDEPTGTAEQDPENNQLYSALTVTPSTLDLPELVPVQAEFDRLLPLNWDDDTDVTVTIENRGGSAAPTAPSTAGIDVAFYLRPYGDTDWALLGHESLPRLGAEDDSNTDTVDINIDASPSQLDLDPGQYELRIVVDEQNLIAEQNETNNELIVGFSVGGTELHPVSLEAPTQLVRQGDTITVVSLIENTGDRSQRDFTVSFYLDDERVDTFYYRAASSSDPGLEEDARARVQGVVRTSDFPPASYSLRVVVDPDNRIPEADEGNNEIRSTLVILPPSPRLAELHLTQVDLLPSSPVPVGTRLVVAATVANSGPIDAGRFQVEYELLHSTDGSSWTAYEAPCCTSTLSSGGTQGQFCACQTVNGLASAGRQVLRQEFTTAAWPEGLYQLRVRVDPVTSDENGTDGAVAELDETNNEMTVFFSVGGVATGEEPQVAGPNLLVRELLVNPSTTVGLGTPLTVAATVSNAGSESAGSFHVEIEWIGPTGSRQTVLSQQLDGLAPGGSKSLFVTQPIVTGLPMGTYRLLARVDTAGEVREADESDNETTVSVSVGSGSGVRADLVAADLRFVPSSGLVEEGQSLEIHLTVRNEGLLASGPFTVTFSTNGAVATETRPSLGPLQQVEITHLLRNLTAGRLEVVAAVDGNAQIDESNESNNTLSAQVEVAPVREAAPIGVVQGDTAVRFLTLDSQTGTIYAVWLGGQIRAISRDGSSALLCDLNKEIGSFTADETRDTGYVGTTSGDVLAISLGTGDVLASTAGLAGSPVKGLAIGTRGQLYAVAGSSIFLLDTSMDVLSEASVGGDALGVAYDAPRDTIYVLTTVGLTAVDTALGSQCAASGFYGAPTCFVVGTTGVFVGTDQGVLYALSFCVPGGAADRTMLTGWRYPATGSLGAAITSIVTDPRDLDPIYATTLSGNVVALRYDGAELWSYPTQGTPVASIQSTPTVEQRSGRLFFGDDAGNPWVLSSDGNGAFDISSAVGGGSPIRSTLVIDEVRRQTDYGTRLFRVYYYGTENGWVYRIESQQ